MATKSNASVGFWERLEGSAQVQFGMNSEARKGAVLKYGDCGAQVFCAKCTMYKGRPIKRHRCGPIVHTAPLETPRLTAATIALAGAGHFAFAQ